jgi:hypothetical protein
VRKQPKKILLHPKTKELISELKKWCDEKYGRRSETARVLDVKPSLVSDWLDEFRVPSLDQGFMIQDFLKKQRQRKK